MFYVDGWTALSEATSAVRQYFISKTISDHLEARAQFIGPLLPEYSPTQRLSQRKVPLSALEEESRTQWHNDFSRNSASAEFKSLDFLWTLLERACDSQALGILTSAAEVVNLSAGALKHCFPNSSTSLYFNLDRGILGAVDPNDDCPSLFREEETEIQKQFRFGQFLYCPIVIETRFLKENTKEMFKADTEAESSLSSDDLVRLIIGFHDAEPNLLQQDLRERIGFYFKTDEWRELWKEAKKFRPNLGKPGPRPLK